MSTSLAEPTAVSGTSSFVRFFPVAARLLLGLMFFVFGLNGFMNFIPQPTEPMPEASVAFATALMATGYMMPMVKGVEVLCGFLLLINRFVPLALALLAPIIVNIVAFHAFLAPMGMVITLIIALLEICLAWAYRDAFRPMLRAKVRPA